MVRDEARSRVSEKQEGTPRARYERPVLRRLGSVNELTLLGPTGSVTDGQMRKSNG